MSIPRKTFIIIMAVLTTSTVVGALFMTLVGGKVIQKSLRNVQALKLIQQEIQRALERRQVQPPFYAYNDLKLATQNFHEDNKLGFGSFGAVYKGTLLDGTKIAVKRLFNVQQEKQVLHEFLNEVVLINGIKHKNLVQLRGCCITEKERILVYEYAEEGNLAQALWGDKRSKNLNWEERFNICVGIARGLCYLHEELQPRIIHRDIKPANILLDGHLNAKIADFGLAKSFLEEETHVEYTHVAGTRGYFAPEYATEGQLTEKADIFSFGILVLEIVCGRKCIALNGPSEQMYLKSWAEKLYKDEKIADLVEPNMRAIWKHNDAVPKVIQIALMCVQADPNLRPTMSQIVTMLLGNSNALPDMLPSPVISQGLVLDAASDNGYDYLMSKSSPHSVPDRMETIDEAPLLINSMGTNSNNVDVELTQLSGRWISHD